MRAGRKTGPEGKLAKLSGVSRAQIRLLGGFKYLNSIDLDAARCLISIARNNRKTKNPPFALPVTGA